MANDLLASFFESFAEGLESKTLNSCSRWSAKRRIMGEPIPGPYSWKMHPWVKGVLDAEAPEIYIMKGAQLGLSEAAINRALYVIDQLKQHVLYVLPTGKAARDFSKGRFNTALLDSPYLKNLFTDSDSVDMKTAGTTNLYIRGSGGKANLISIPVAQLLLDEVDRMDQKEIALAIERLSGMPPDKRSIWGLSTPTIPNHGIHKLYMQGTQDHFFFKCPSCSRHTELIWPDCMEIIGESASDPRCRESFLKCKECQAKLHHELKKEWLSDAEWHSTAPNANTLIRTFQVSQLYSFMETPGNIVVAHFKGMGDEAAATEFYNSKLGLPFVGENAQITDVQIDNCIGNYTTDGVKPKDGEYRIITLGIDVGKWSYYTLMEWFVKPGKDVCANAHGKVIGFGKFLEEEFDTTLDALMYEYQVFAAVIDSEPYTDLARKFARRFPGHVYLNKFLRGYVGKEMTVGDEESGAPMCTCDRTNWFSSTFSRYRTKRVELPTNISLEYRQHLKNIVRKYEKDDKGNWHCIYVSTGPDHFGLSAVYAEIALPFAARIDNGGEDVTDLIL